MTRLNCLRFGGFFAGDFSGFAPITFGGFFCCLFFNIFRLSLWYQMGSISGRGREGGRWRIGYERKYVKINLWWCILFVYLWYIFWIPTYTFPPYFSHGTQHWEFFCWLSLIHARHTFVNFVPSTYWMCDNDKDAQLPMQLRKWTNIPPPFSSKTAMTTCCLGIYEDLFINVYITGDHQQVASFSFYGEWKSAYYRGIQENAESIEVNIILTIFLNTQRKEN